MFDVALYTIGWICAIPCELTAARLHLDNEHPSSDYEAQPNDNNTYIFGNIDKHHIVIATLPDGEYGTSSAATVAKDMIRSIPNLKIGIMVGIAGGAPLMEPHEKKKQDIRLGDVVVSTPGNGQGGVYQFDYGKAIQNMGFKPTRHLNSPPATVRGAVTVLRSDFDLDGNSIEDEVRELLSTRSTRLKNTYGKPDDVTDRLYKASYIHTDIHQSCVTVCDGDQEIVERNSRTEDKVSVHYGLIASSNTLMKDAVHRETLAREHGILCFEMEAAGLMNLFPFLVVRGICDYSDTHKNKEWQGYAAMTAAAYTRKLLFRLPTAKVAEASRLRESEEIKSYLEEINSNLDIMQSDLVEHTQRSLRADIERWLDAPDPETNFQSMKEQREPGTGKWLVESEAYLRWKSGFVRHLWLHGKAGCGKSVICSSIIEDIRRHCISNTDMSHAIFYFTFSDSRKQSHIDCLRSILYQLSGSRSVSSSLEQLYKMSKDRQKRTSRAEDGLQNRQEEFPGVEDGLQNILIDGIRSYKTFFLVIDALDESPETDSNAKRIREKLLEWLHDLSIKLPMLQILATSRRLPDIETQLSDMKFHQESMINACVNVDINKYVVNQLNKDRRLRKHDADMKKKIQDTFMAKADGMFHWAICQMNDLKKLPSTRPSDLEKALIELPASLDETYNKMINQIPRTVQKDALILLRWLTYSRRPLTLMELSEARIISLETVEGEVAVGDRGCAEDVLEILSGLVLIVETKDKTLAAEEVDIEDESDIEVGNIDSAAEKLLSDDDSLHRSVRLAHFSVQEYLESLRESIARPPLFHFQAQRENQLLSHCCVVYLTHYANTKWITKTSQDLERFPLLEYAASSWYTHCQNNDDVQREVQFVQSGAFLLSLLVHNPERSYQKPFKKSGTSDIDAQNREASRLYYAAYLGLSGVCEILIEAGADVNAQAGKLCHDALQAAAARGHDLIVKMLIEAGADVSARGGKDHIKALQVAAAGGHDSIVRMLIEAGADVSARGGKEYSNALQDAAARGHDSTVKILIEAGAGVNTQDKFDRNALKDAVYHGHESTVKMLIEDYGAEVNTQGARYITVLQAAAVGGHDSIVKMLIEDYGADVNAHGRKYGSALRAAFIEVHDSIVKGFGLIVKGHESIVKMLIEAGADVNAQGRKYGSALQGAAFRGHDSIVKMLIEAGADVNAQSINYCSPLQAAASHGNDLIVKMLIEAGADVNAQGGWYGSALQAAAEVFKNDLIVKMLIEAGADVNAQGGRYGSALQAATETGQDSIIKMLLEAGAGADVDARGIFLSDDTLCAVAKGGHDSTVRLLIEAGADGGARALYAAAAVGRDSTVRLLIEAGADVNAGDGFDKERFIADAGRNEYSKIVKMLIDAGAHICPQTYSGSADEHIRDSESEDD